jgi:hypothetical protein
VIDSPNATRAIIGTVSAASPVIPAETEPSATSVDAGVVNAASPVIVSTEPTPLIVKSGIVIAPSPRTGDGRMANVICSPDFFGASTVYATAGVRVTVILLQTGCVAIVGVVTSPEADNVSIGNVTAPPPVPLVMYFGVVLRK